MRREQLVFLFAGYNKRLEPESAAAYLEILGGRDDDLVGEAIRLERIASPTFLPTAAAIDARCRAILREREARALPEAQPDHSVPLEAPLRVALPTGGELQITREYYHDCNTCRDTGWQDRWCGPMGPTWREEWPMESCGRRHVGAGEPGHHWASRCPCAHTNPTIRRRQAPREVVAL